MKKIDSKASVAYEKKLPRSGLKLIQGGSGSPSVLEGQHETSAKKEFTSQLAARLEKMADELDLQIKILSKI